MTFVFTGLSGTRNVIYGLNPNNQNVGIRLIGCDGNRIGRCKFENLEVGVEFVADAQGNHSYGNYGYRNRWYGYIGKKKTEQCGACDNPSFP